MERGLCLREGQLQKKLMETLNWKGYDFKEIEPDYTNQLLPGMQLYR